MDAARYAKVQELFEVSHGLDARERKRVLERACVGDEDLLALVNRLLDASSQSGGAFGEESLAVGRAQLEELFPDDYSAIPSRIASYRIRRVLGQGGMGVVYEAEQESPRRLVALKVVPATLATATRRRRLEREADLLGRLRHPGIAQIYEAGSCHLEGIARPFFAMEFVDGVNLLHYAEDHRLDRDGQLQLLAKLCEPVQHAHEQNIVHRDLKPENVLVEDEGRLKVLDFGIARFAEGADGGVSEITVEGEVVGTLGYMAPEQIQGNSARIGPRTDVYALGVIAYRMIAGTLPFETSGLPASSVTRLVLEREPMALRKAARGVPRDVETIVHKCLRKDPSARYATAAELGADLRRYLQNQPIIARPLALWERAVRFCRRNFVLVTGTVATFLALMAGAIVALSLERKASHNAEEAQHQAERANLARSQMRENLYFAEMVLAAESADTPSGVARARQILANWAPAVGESDLRGWEWNLFDSVSRRVASDADLDFVPIALDWSPAGDRVAAGGWVGLGIHDAQTLEMIHRLSAPSGARCVAFDEKGARLLTASEDGVSVWDARRGELAWKREDQGAFKAACWSGAEDQVYGLSRTGVLWAFDASSGDTSHRTESRFQNYDDLIHLDLSPSGDELALLDHENYIAVVSTHDWGINRGSLDGMVGVTRGLLWSPDGLRLASGGSDGKLRVWDSDTLELLLTIHAHRRAIHDLRWIDGETIGSASQDWTLCTWDATNGRRLDRWRGHQSAVSCLDLSPDGTQLVSASNDLTLRRWAGDVPAAFRTVTMEAPGTPPSHGRVQWHPREDRLLTYVEGMQAACVSPSEIRSLDLQHAAWSADGRWLAGRVEEKLEVWDAGSLQVHRRDDDRLFFQAFDWHPREAVLAAAIHGDDSTLIRIHSVADGEIRTYPDPLENPRAVVWSPAGDRLFTTSRDEVWRLNPESDEIDFRWRRADRDSQNELPWSSESRWPRTLDPSPDGRHVAIAYEDGRVQIVHLDSATLVQEFFAHGSSVHGLSWHPEGSRLATAGGDASVKLWDPWSGALAASFRCGEGMLAVDWSPDGRQLASVSERLEVFFWDARLSLESRGGGR